MGQFHSRYCSFTALLILIIYCPDSELKNYQLCYQLKQNLSHIRNIEKNVLRLILFYENIDVWYADHMTWSAWPDMLCMTWHVQHDQTCSAWHDMFNITWHALHDLTCSVSPGMLNMTWHALHDLTYSAWPDMLCMTWHALHDLTCSTWPNMLCMT